MTAPLTADTITDEQIRELRDEPARCARDLNEADLIFIAAMRALDGDLEARARCAEILNARKESKC